MIETAVLFQLEQLRRATFAVLCARLPFAKSSISFALNRLQRKKKVELRRGCCGEFWRLVRTPPTKGN